MTVQRVGLVVPVQDLDAAVGIWTVVLGVEPTFVDGDRWAQFDLNGTRVSLAGTDRVAEIPGAMVKVDDLEAMTHRLEEAGCQVSEATEGAHEQRAVAILPGGWPLVLHAPLRA